MLRPISARNHGLMPVAARTTSCGTPRRSRPRTRHSRESDGSRNCFSTIGAADRWANRELSHDSPRSSIQRITVSSPAGSSGSLPSSTGEA
jgi:hypothetical protein